MTHDSAHSKSQLILRGMKSKPGRRLCVVLNAVGTTTGIIANILDDGKCEITQDYDTAFDILVQ